jgi:hypothetical protein
VTAKRLGRRTAGWARRSAVVAAAVAIVAAAVPTSAPAVTLADAPRILQAVAGPATGAVAIAWDRASDNGSPIRTYGFSMSVNGGTTWTAVHSFASRNLVQSTASFPSFVCTNTTAGSTGCLFRIHAANVLGFGPPSKPVALWTVPSAPRALEALADFDFSTAALAWKAPTVTGGFRITGYDVLAALDGAAPKLLTTVSTPGVTVPCTATRTCAYSVRAINARGKGPASAPRSITPAPGLPQNVVLQNTGSDSATGRSVLKLAWKQPLTGLPADRYDVEVCGLRVGVPTSCDPPSTNWTGRSEVFPTTSDPLAETVNCGAGYLTCLTRVRAVNARGGAGPWRPIDLEPWAPYGLTVTRGPARGSVTVHFRGPAESGRSGTGTKHYRVIVCDAACDVAANWRMVSDAVPYPPAPPAPYLAGWFSCRSIPPTVPPAARQCRVRMQFVDGLGNAGILSAAVAGYERP